MDIIYGESNLIDVQLPLTKVYHDTSLVGDGTKQRPLRLSTATLDADTDLTASPTTNLTASGLTATFTANENQAFGDACFINADGEAQIADATTIATASVIALCIDTVTANNTGTYLLQGFARKDAWSWTVGQPIYLSLTGTTTNTLTQTAPSSTDEVIQILGIATHADRIYFNPQLVQIEHI